MVKLFFYIKSHLTSKLPNSSSSDRQLTIRPHYDSPGDSSLLERIVLGVGVLLLLVCFMNMAIINHRSVSEQKSVDQVITD